MICLRVLTEPDFCFRCLFAQKMKLKKMRSKKQKKLFSVNFDCLDCMRRDKVRDKDNGQGQWTRTKDKGKSQKRASPSSIIFYIITIGSTVRSLVLQHYRVTFDIRLTYTAVGLPLGLRTHSLINDLSSRDPCKANLCISLILRICNKNKA